MEWFDAQGALVGLAITAGVFLAMALAELVRPQRVLRHPKARRWFTNLALFALDSVLVRLAIPLLMVGTAVLAEERGWGLFNRIELPGWLAFALTIVLLDLALYLQHWASHRIPLLWRLHKVHHADPDFDVTTAGRFHPVEIGLSMGYKMAVVALIGPPAMAVFVFEVLFNAASIFVHANVSLPGWAESPARAIFVTPDMHRVHHSSVQRETDSNYGTMLSGWDRLFSTYVAEPAAGRDGLTIGLEHYQDDRPTRLGWSLLLPFRR